ncbi:MAG: hypothetical protein M1826_002611 [Phylliscum demangeonii]|nr:MAG: hypothetical protein M1826_002611 [Phylliscum demangeonii]
MKRLYLFLGSMMLLVGGVGALPTPPAPPPTPPSERFPLGGRMIGASFYERFPKLNPSQKQYVQEMHALQYDDLQRIAAVEAQALWRDRMPAWRVNELRKELWTATENRMLGIQEGMAMKGVHVEGTPDGEEARILTARAKIRVELRQQRNHLNKYLDQGCTASQKADWGGRSAKAHTSEADRCLKRVSDTSARIRTLTQQLEALNKGGATDEQQATKPESKTEFRPAAVASSSSSSSSSSASGAHPNGRFGGGGGSQIQSWLHRATRFLQHSSTPSRRASSAGAGFSPAGEERLSGALNRLRLLGAE